MVNQLIGGRYRVLQSLGEGGLAKTYIAEDHNQPNRPKLVVKVLKLVNNKPDLFFTAQRLFKKEAETLEKIGHHDQIPCSFDYFEENQEFYLVQEFIKGHTLDRELPKGQRWAENRVIEMLQDVLQILEFVHSFGVIHRDIKPNNIIRRQQDNRLVLIDFGSVKQVCVTEITAKGKITEKTIAIGTPGYMPTEQVLGKPQFNSDIYALGTIAVQAVTGLKPLNLQEDINGEIIWRKLARVSDELAAILNKMICANCRERYQSTTQVIKAIKQLPNYCPIVPTTPNKKKTKLPVNIKPKLLGISSVSQATSNTFFNLDRTKETEKSKQPINLGLEKLTSKVVLDREKKVKEITITPATRLNSNLTRYRIFKIGTVILVGLVSMLVGYLYTSRRQSYLKAKAFLGEIEILKQTKNYQQCLQQAQTFTSEYLDLSTQVESIIQECKQGRADEQLVKAVALAKQEKWSEAIAIANGISENTESYENAQRFIAQSYQDILQIARDRYQAGNLSEAIDILNSNIPADSNLIATAKETIQQWQQEWQQNKTYLEVAQQAITNLRWQDAIDAASKVNGNEYWQKQSRSIIQKAEVEIAKAQEKSQKTVPNSSPIAPTPTKKIIPRSRPVPQNRKIVPISPEIAPTPTKKIIPNPSSIPRPDIINPNTVEKERPSEWICLNNPNPKCRK